MASVGQVGDANRLVMVSLLIADELSEAYAELEVVSSAEKGAAAMILAEDSLSSQIDKMADRVENILKEIK